MLPAGTDDGSTSIASPSTSVLTVDGDRPTRPKIAEGPAFSSKTGPRS
jgi:hypothetical protein